MKYILAADDEAINRDILGEILEDDYEIKCVNDGVECIKCIEERMPDLLLLDVGMPVMNGIEVCKVLRKNESTKGLPVILLSGYADSDNINAGMAAGADEYLAKPFPPLELLDAIKKYLS
ncbi:MAG: response regulator [Gammaproteobacteria bacterium]|nr:response regulator [Gammaproteobacteria bacterium]